jgi:hypothetical protein
MEYKLVTPRIILNAAGAREKFLRFPGNNLARIYGAGAFQTLVIETMVRPTNRLFIIGGGNCWFNCRISCFTSWINVVGLLKLCLNVEDISSFGQIEKIGSSYLHFAYYHQC